MTALKTQHGVVSGIDCGKLFTLFKGSRRSGYRLKGLIDDDFDRVDEGVFMTLARTGNN